MKLFELILSKGTFISTNGVIGTNSGFTYYKGDKGLALKGTSGDTVTFTQTLTGVKTIMFAIRKNADSKIILDNITDKLEVSGGDVSATGLTQCYINNVDTDTIGNEYKLVIAEFNAGIDFATNIKIAPSSLIHLAHKIVFYDEILSANQRAKEMDSFLNSYPMLQEKFIRYGSWNKITDSSGKQSEGLLLHYNMVKSAGNKIIDISNNETATTAQGTISSLAGLKFNGRSDYIPVNLPVTPAATVKTIGIRVKFVTTTEMFYEGQSNAILILANAGTLEASDYDHIYINGVESSTVVAGKWMNIIVTSSTVVDNNTPSIGYNSGTFDYGAFELESFQVWSSEWSIENVQNWHNEYAGKAILADNLRWDAVGSKLPLNVRKESGVFEVDEDSTGKFIKCTGGGNIIYPGIDLSKYIGNGWVKKLTGDLSGDEGGTVDAATSLSYANGKLTITMTTGQKLRDICITEGEKL